VQFLYGRVFEGIQEKTIIINKASCDWEMERVDEIKIKKNRAKLALAVKTILSI